MYYNYMLSNHCLHCVQRRHTFQLIIHPGLIFSCNFQETLPFQAWYCSSPELQLSLEAINQLSFSKNTCSLQTTEIFKQQKKALMCIYVYGHRKMNQILSCTYQLNKNGFFTFDLKPKPVFLFSQHCEFTLHLRPLNFLNSNNNPTTYQSNSEKLPQCSKMLLHFQASIPCPLLSQQRQPSDIKLL